MQFFINGKGHNKASTWTSYNSNKKSSSSISIFLYTIFTLKNLENFSGNLKTGNS